MFTGLVETVGVVRAVSGGSPCVLRIEADLPTNEVAIGDSVAVDGVCLTLVKVGSGGGSWFEFEAATETMQRTMIGSLRPGNHVNLERAMRLGDRFGGHLVSGHVDCVGEVCIREHRGSALCLGIAVGSEVSRLSVARGSITLAGVSLTINEIDGEVILVGLIPHTASSGVTTLSDRKVGDRLNVEADLIGRYLDRLLESRAPGNGNAQKATLTMDYLRDKGFA